jgi:hypothetical protein
MIVVNHTLSYHGYLMTYNEHIDRGLGVPAMNMQVTLTLPDEVHTRAHSIAQLTGWTLEDAIITMLEVSLPTLIPLLDLDTPVAELSNEQVLALTHLQMTPHYDQRHSVLLQKRQASTLLPAEKRELANLQRVYEIGLIYKSQALAEATKRGLRAPLQP